MPWRDGSSWLDPQRGLALVVLAMLPGLSWSPTGLRMATAAALALALVRGARFGLIGWSAVTGLLAAGVALEPLSAPNHQFALGWAALAVALSKSLPVARQQAALADASRLLLAAILLLATLQRLLADGFADGSFFHFLMLQGGLGAWGLEAAVPGLAEATAQNRLALDGFLGVQPTVTAELPLTDPWDALGRVALGLSWATLGAEALLAALLLTRPGAQATHFLVLAFAWGVFALRPESVFLAAVCALGGLACPEDAHTVRRLYATSVALLSALALLGVTAPA